MTIQRSSRPTHHPSSLQVGTPLSPSRLSPAPTPSTCIPLQQRSREHRATFAVVVQNPFLSYDFDSEGFLNPLEKFATGLWQDCACLRSSLEKGAHIVDRLKSARSISMEPPGDRYRERERDQFPDGERERHRQSRDDETHEERKRRRQEKRRRREERRARRDESEEAGGSPPSPKRTRRNEGERVAASSAPSDGAFVWKKKIELQRRRGERVDVEEESLRCKELAKELEGAKRRRAERDAERAAWEEEQAMLARDKEQEENAGWHRAEASFHGAQHFLRQAIRIRQGRPVGTDMLARSVRLDLLDVTPDERDAIACLAEMSEGGVEELERLAEEVEKELDYIPDYETDGDTAVFNRRLRIDWWECVKVCVLSMLEKERASRSYGGAGGVHSAVEADLDAMLNGKSMQKLVEMETEISKRLDPTGPSRTNDEFAEIDFWTAALARIRHRLAEQRIRDMDDLLSKERAQKLAAIPKHEKPTLAKDAHDLDEGTAADLDMLQKERAGGMGADEEKFTDEVEVGTKKRELPAAGYAWNDKYRPRKPRYYNRVHTGYDWTKYNRTHYDHDNPPPKTVQGYRFNIFYPDLIDPSKTPTYTISKTDNPEVSILTFKAGPPYEDLAFKIVNRQWEFSHRRGYRCSFDKGILQLWFNFQRYRYRR